MTQQSIRNQLALMYRYKDVVKIKHNGVKHHVTLDGEGFQIISCYTNFPYSHNKLTTPSLREAVAYIENARTVQAGDVYARHSGRKYTVLAIANNESADEQDPPSVMYQGVNGLIWCMPLERFHETMKYVGTKPMFDIHVDPKSFEDACEVLRSNGFDYIEEFDQWYKKDQ